MHGGRHRDTYNRKRLTCLQRECVPRCSVSMPHAGNSHASHMRSGSRVKAPSILKFNFQPMSRSPPAPSCACWLCGVLLATGFCAAEELQHVSEQVRRARKHDPAVARLEHQQPQPASRSKVHDQGGATDCSVVRLQDLFDMSTQASCVFETVAKLVEDFLQNIQAAAARH